MPRGNVQLLINGRPGNPERGISIGAGDLPRRSIKLALDNIGRDHQKTLVRNMRKRDKTGAIYNVKIRGRKRRHQASRPPDENLANFTGAMALGTDYVVSGDNMTFGTTEKGGYSRFWEVNAPNRSKRRTLQNTVRELERNTFNYYADEIQKELFKIFNPVSS